MIVNWKGVLMTKQLAKLLDITDFIIATQDEIEFYNQQQNQK